MLRAVESAGGFATVLRKGEREAGTILVILAEKGESQRLFERMPNPESGREWVCTLTEDLENKWDFSESLERRWNRDPDLWIIELDIADGERFIP